MTRVIALLWDAEVSGASLEALGTAGGLATSLGAELEAVAMNPSPALLDALGSYGVASAVRLAGDDAASDLVAALAEVTGRGPEIVVAARSPRGLAVLPRLAARTGGACVMGVVGLEAAGGEVTAVSAIFGGAARAKSAFRAAGPRIAGLSAGPRAEPGTMRQVAVREVAIPADARLRVVTPAAAREGPQLQDANVVVSGGRGLKDRENYGLVRELAAALGGMPGASRAIVDEHWAKPAEQVGLTGTVVTPELYIAAGISGASQHMAGCSNARTLVAINTDPDAPIFRYAKFGVVDDCLAVLPELIALAKARAKTP